MGSSQSQSVDASSEPADSLRARWKRAVQDSAVVGGATDFGGGLASAWQAAVTNSAVGSAFRPVERGLSAVERTLSRWTRGSRIVGWFLAEPDPEVIVIDLRETYTAGPVIRLVEWTADRAAAGAERTGVAAAWSGLGRRLEAEPLRLGGLLLVAVALGGLVGALLSSDALGGWLVALGAGLLATRERRSAGELAETRVGGALVAAFEPPEPPDRDE